MVKSLRSEKDVKKAVRAVLKKHGVWVFMPVASGFGVSGIPDFVGAFNDGAMFAIETKFGVNTCTEHQSRQIDELRKRKVPVWIVRDTTVEGFAMAFAVEAAKHDAMQQLSGDSE